MSASAMLSAPAFMSSAIVPAVLISACCLLLLTINNRIVAVLTRQRALHRELRDLLNKDTLGKSACGGGRGGSLSGSWPSFAGGACGPCAPPAAAAADASISPAADALISPAAAAALCADPAAAEWAAALEGQIADLRREAALIRAAVAAVLAAILHFLASGVALGIATFERRAETAAMVAFLLGLACLALGVGLMLSESMLLIAPLVTEERAVQRIKTFAQTQTRPASHVSLTVLAN